MKPKESNMTGEKVGAYRALWVVVYEGGSEGDTVPVFLKQKGELGEIELGPEIYPNTFLVKSDSKKFREHIQRNVVVAINSDHKSAGSKNR